MEQRIVKLERDGTLNGCQLTDGILSNDAAAVVTSLAMQTYQLATSGSSGLQFLQASPNNSSLQWMMPPQYQMMLLQQGQSIFAPNVLSLQDGHVLVTPLNESVNIDNSQQIQLQQLQQQQQQQLQQQQQQLQQQQQQQQQQQVEHNKHARSRTNDSRMQTTSSQVHNNGTHGDLSTIARSKQQAEIAQKQDLPRPPKKPLTPYMIFSKTIWPQVKAANTHLSSVCEIGAIVGALWRDLDASQKQLYNEYFVKDKERYEAELRAYLKMTGLHASDLVKAPKQKRCKDTSNNKSSHVPWSGPVITAVDSQAEVVTANASIDPLRSDNLSNVNQLLTQVGLASGQTLYANSDGTISIDGSNIANFLALHSQSLQLMSTTGAQVTQAGSYNGGRQDGEIQLNSGQIDQSTANWLWQQAKASGTGQVDAGGGVILYQLPVCNDQQGETARENGLSTESGFSGDAGQRQFFDVNHIGQIMKQESVGGANSVDAHNSELEAELQQLRGALSEKTHEVQSLSCKLEDAQRMIEQYKLQMNGICSEDNGRPDDTTNGDGDAEDGSTPTVNAS